MGDYDVDIIKELEQKADLIRHHVIDMTCEAGSGHPGGSLSSADIFTALFFQVMRHDPSYPQWDGRDRFVLSKGHCAPAYYAVLAESGYMPVDELWSLRKLGSRLQGHPSRTMLPYVEMSTGSLGQGLSVSNGLALAFKLDGSDSRVYCICGDGEMQSGQNWEAGMFAAHYGLDNITAFVDRNRLQIDGCTEDVMAIDPIADKWKAFGWHVIEIDGHDMIQILDACQEAIATEGRPTMVIAHTTKGKGVSFMEDNAGFHGKCCTPEERVQACKELEGCQ